MHPALTGAHFAVVCSDCDYPFQVGADSVPRNQTVVCPNCGCPGIPVTKGMLADPDQLLFAPSEEPVGRWDPVCFRDRGSERILVKRIVGLPGETRPAAGRPRARQRRRPGHTV